MSELTIENGLAEFTMMHDDFIIDWNKAMKTGDTSALERMHEDYYVTFFNGSHEKPMLFSREEATEGMRESVNQLLGAQKKFNNRVIRLKNSENAAVFYELLIEKDEKVLARLFTIETWQLIKGKWMLVREVEEPIS
ncbi:hypothetical protein [Fredinandcohnia onubensis]|uniref:hypothetical protein n=1 Tax=Fredinandcohnia onubensis TaxID=1571209 RepID=UPI001FE692C5|nr:hypothetical protein [Fredinandcohnia onubensis]